MLDYRSVSFVDTSVVLHTYRNHSAKSDPTILSPKSDEQIANFGSPHPKAVHQLRNEKYRGKTM